MAQVSNQVVVVCDPDTAVGAYWVVRLDSTSYPVANLEEIDMCCIAVRENITFQSWKARIIELGPHILMSS